MIKTLQRRFILITMASISLVFALILLVLNISVNYSARHQGYAVLYQYAQRQSAPAGKDHEGFPELPGNALPESIHSENNPPENVLPKNIFPKDKNSKNGAQRSNKLPPTDPPAINWFNNMRISYVLYNKDGSLTDLSTGQDPDMTRETLIGMVDDILPRSKEKGIISGYLYLVQKNEEGTRIYFLDYSPEKDMSMRLFEICLWIGLAGIFVILVPVIFLSRWVTRPVQYAFDKQRRFIADASHELKTPLTIITTNAEVLQNNLKDNKWLSHILEQTSRMKVLINSLLELARIDAYSDMQDFGTFDLSRTVKNAALSFESLAYEYQKQFIMEIADGLSINGSESGLKQLTTILLDNAFKYSEKEGIIKIKLSANGDKKELRVYNTGSGIPPNEQILIFERFYRCDTSRSRKSGGYGLGLSIARSITESHKGQIHVKSDGKSYTEFLVTLP